jgi:hypothetical protein
MLALGAWSAILVSLTRPRRGPGLFVKGRAQREQPAHETAHGPDHRTLAQGAPAPQPAHNDDLGTDDAPR